MEIEKTQRGFGYIEFKDLNGVECKLQKSSLATEDAIYIGAKKIGIQEFNPSKYPETSWSDRPEFDEFKMEHHYSGNNLMHLTREQVRELLPYLINFMHTGELE